MKLLCVVNEAARIHDAGTTTALLVAAIQRGHDVSVCGAGALSVGVHGSIIATAHPASLTDGQLILGAAASAPLTSAHTVLIRTNPGRDTARAWMHEAVLRMLVMARDLGVTVVNDPAGLLLASSKLYLSVVPQAHRPLTLISRNRAELRAFFAEVGKGVLKPLTGSHGRDVFLIDDGTLGNLNQIIDVLTRDGFAMAQSFIPEAPQGDTRLLLLDGVPLMVDGQVAAVHRVPGAGDFRSNVSAGGRAEAGVITPVIAEIAAAIGPRLASDGILLAGLDIIGSKVVEVNTFSPGGLPDAGRFCGVDFLAPVLDAIEAR
ncbi:MAG: glutathione synthase [Myxococcota bacterium]|jgi:glutathione synthase